MKKNIIYGAIGAIAISVTSIVPAVLITQKHHNEQSFRIQKQRLISQIETLEQKLNDIKDKLVGQNGLDEVFKEKINEFQKFIDELKIKINDLTSQNNDLLDEIADLKSELKLKDLEIADLQKQITDLKMEQHYFKDLIINENISLVPVTENDKLFEKFYRLIIFSSVVLEANSKVLDLDVQQDFLANETLSEWYGQFVQKSISKPQEMTMDFIKQWEIKFILVEKELKKYGDKSEEKQLVEEYIQLFNLKANVRKEMSASIETIIREMKTPEEIFDNLTMSMIDAYKEKINLIRELSESIVDNIFEFENVLQSIEKINYQKKRVQFLLEAPQKGEEWTDIARWKNTRPSIYVVPDINISDGDLLTMIVKELSRHVDGDVKNADYYTAGKPTPLYPKGYEVSKLKYVRYVNSTDVNPVVWSRIVVIQDKPAEETHE
ncbi:IncA family protein [[Acholeplasma] multilocale]|uniref:IncA family protein n=1 Tax=[Acholeplasma] multilocale TaxID=264638 RepID=UPI000479AFBB|nr:IncA family protein [[Acholeplasma] multilocale]